MRVDVLNGIAQTVHNLNCARQFAVLNFHTLCRRWTESEQLIQPRPGEQFDVFLLQLIAKAHKETLVVGASIGADFHQRPVDEQRLQSVARRRIVAFGVSH